MVVAGDEYILPKDRAEGERLDLQHRILRFGLETNILAPLPEAVTSVLDVGCGTGIWGREVARQFPHAAIMNLDSDARPVKTARENIKNFPRNFEFVQRDLREPLPDDWIDRFQYTHMRLLSAGLVFARWPSVLAELARVTAPGGWVELVESELPDSPSPAYMTIKAAILRLADQLLGFYAMGPRLAVLLHGAALQHVQTYRAVLGADGEERERNQQPKLQPMIAEDLLAGFRGIRETLLKFNMISSDVFTAAITAMPEEVAAMGILWPVQAAWGQKTL